MRQLGYHRGLHALRLGELDRAEPHLRDWLRDLPPGMLASRYPARVRLAEVLVRRGELNMAVAELTAAMDQLDSLRQTLDDRLLAATGFQARGALDEPDLGLATILAALIQAGHPETAFLLSERRRARMLAERLLRNRLASSGGEQPSPRGPALAVPVVDLKATLPPATALIEFVAGRRGQPTIAFLVSTSGLDAVILPELDRLEPEIARLATLLAAGEAATGPARRVGEAILDSVLARLRQGTTTLQIVPHGALHRAPFDAIRLADGQAVVDRYRIALVPSAGVAAALARRQGNADGGVLALGDPRFASEAGVPEEGASEVFREAFDSVGGLPRLEASGEEARMVARYGRTARLRLRGDASEAFLKHEARGRFQVIHFATHALVDGRSPTRTALALSPGGGEDGFLGPRELADLRLDADLVVLSACRTAGGIVVEGDGIQDPTGPMLEAGTSVV